MKPAALRAYNAVCQWLTQVKREYNYRSMRHKMLCLLKESKLDATATWEEYCHNEAIMGRAVFDG